VVFFFCTELLLFTDLNIQVSLQDKNFHLSYGMECDLAQNSQIVRRYKAEAKYAYHESMTD